MAKNLSTEWGCRTETGPFSFRSQVRCPGLGLVFRWYLLAFCSIC